MDSQGESTLEKKIVVTEDGPYFVLGGIPLVRKVQVVSAFGEPLAWKMEGAWEMGDCYVLCRCGNSHEKPFCDGTHCQVEFDGRETADTGPSAARQLVLPGSSAIVIRRDQSLCSQSGFCGNRFATIDQLVLQADDPVTLSQLLAMVERCPSGALTCTLEQCDQEIEPDLPAQVAVTTDFTCEGPVPGALWVTGGVPLESSSGQRYELRNRVTLCCCGRSHNKPLCDGKHREMRESSAETSVEE